MNFKTFFLKLFCCSPPDPAKLYEAQAKEAAIAYAECDGTQSAERKVQLLDDTIFQYRALLGALQDKHSQEDNEEYVYTKFTLANFHLDAGEMATDPQPHLERAKILYNDVLEVWRRASLKPVEYPELLSNLGRLYYDLFEIEQDKKANGAAILQNALEFFEGCLSFLATKDASEKTSVKQMIGIVISRRYQLEQNDTKLDQGIRYLSTVFTLDTELFNDSEYWKNIDFHVIIAQLASSIDQSPQTSRIRDLSLLHLSQVFLFRFKQHGHSLDLQRAEAVVFSASPIVSSTVASELATISQSIHHLKEKQTISTARVFRPSNNAPTKTCKPEQSKASSSMSPSPQYLGFSQPKNPTTSSVNSSRAHLPIGNNSSPPLLAYQSRPEHIRASSPSTSTTDIIQGKGKKPQLSVQPPASGFQSPSNYSPKSPTSRYSNH